jgi:hypothetical protein
MDLNDALAYLMTEGDEGYDKLESMTSEEKQKCEDGEKAEWRLRTWQSIKQSQPAVGQTVCFICKSDDPVYNNMALGGKYLGDNGLGHEFSTPGFTIAGEWWMPMKEVPWIPKDK